MAILIPEIHKRGILVVDDTASLRGDVRSCLHERGYLNVFEANDGTEAFARLHELDARIYLIILDIRIPEPGGLAFLQNLQNTHTYPVGVVALTAFPEQKVRSMFFKLGTNNVMALEFVDKNSPLSKFFEDIHENLERVHSRRTAYLNAHWSEIQKSIEALSDLKDRVATIETKIDRLSDRVPGFLAQVGTDLVRALIIALAIIAFIYIGVGDFLQKLIRSLHGN